MTPRRRYWSAAADSPWRTCPAVRSGNTATGAGTLVGYIGPRIRSYNTGDIAIEPLVVPEPASILLVASAALTYRRQ